MHVQAIIKTADLIQRREDFAPRIRISFLDVDGRPLPADPRLELPTRSLPLWCAVCGAGNGRNEVGLKDTVGRQVTLDYDPEHDSGILFRQVTPAETV
ncbi:hypothetical protein [Bifidobacterium felsineum]|uniref:hypothetical protein n=1 Tax=Bifidobacterium felsineum TaxID=2045440 RepID=UPI001BDCAE90|nr:hypothetical protein [Bifidobacterium felsineum]MBT1164638.1 hypothetical protein [Bifidobacterium felsineum]